ncbi:hypothetical protein ACVWWG_001798 [Bradyrhizobium sp. LB7.2]
MSPPTSRAKALPIISMPPTGWRGLHQFGRGADRRPVSDAAPPLSESKHAPPFARLEISLSVPNLLGLALARPLLLVGIKTHLAENVRRSAARALYDSNRNKGDLSVSGFGAPIPRSKSPLSVRNGEETLGALSVLRSTRSCRWFGNAYATTRPLTGGLLVANATSHFTNPMQSALLRCACPVCTTMPQEKARSYDTNASRSW